MIRGIRFATRRDGLTPEEFAAAWPEAVAAAAQAPPGVRPSRLAVCTVLPDLAGPGPGPRHGGVEIGWFADEEHLRRFRGWVGTPQGWAVLKGLDRLVDHDASPVIVAEEAVLRGADWLEERWRRGGAKLKHMAIAVRAEGLTPAEFSARWRDHAGRVRKPGEKEPVPIPAEARGLAYVQNHPLPKAAGEWPYDALNEVYFDDPEGLRARIAWFRENYREGEDDLFGRSWFLTAREELI